MLSIFSEFFNKIIIELSNSKIYFIMIGIIFFIIISYRVYRRLNVKCTYCKVKMRLVSVSNYTGDNKKIQVTFFIDLGPRRYTQNWLCDNCGHKKYIKAWG